MIKGICQFCEEERDLCESHIIPEFFYKPLYDSQDKNRIYGFSTQSSYVKVFQQGAWQHLFCRDCEDIFHRYEDYVAPLYEGGFWEQGRALKFTDGTICPDAIDLTGIDYHRFKLLFLSVFWRLSLKTKYFPQIQLGPHRDSIKKMLSESDAGSERRHGIAIARMTLKDEHVSGLVGTFQEGRAGSKFRMHVVILGGYAVYLWLGKPDIPDDFLGIMTREKGSQAILTLQIERMKGLHYMPKMLKGARTPFWKDSNKSIE